MLRKEFIQLVENTVDAGFERGVNLFLENLEETMGKEAVFEQFGGVDGTINALMEEEFDLPAIEASEVVEESTEEELTDDNIDHVAVDAILDELEKEGFVG
jgi:hypothetical protein